MANEWKVVKVGDEVDLPAGLPLKSSCYTDTHPTWQQAPPSWCLNRRERSAARAGHQLDGPLRLAS